ncbi:similar to Saccharomyces cerevisiae YPL249C GYP5 GTPase- activating protein (GAP) for yeast Rab family members [Maudiozyma barnettii]|uniref:Similar to Saccharomyces cerevisiae YPL249C GYP5 GTPase- activating protein (GAP) for yeast Rab family members n=1 Tax=Maudiozyma barnettii TaxID=61262 RepID=A0A8H2VEW9_9SACH|nr:uncharacterized protein KABA2_04S03586 [Kazachstania barnettii]CAB4254321.1 similar to Saccharomyces cerevisiae YPL249C GYP5 GTPase- activating protein (GAP) for yeast Rab family members [Kazachstania barnettii]CAD1782153.1 similar to Saccharomyces cerevisiae YPL249C GYP5 GTPase- activating protein (GAP) for yeast Rab family members [Kazachstania barnettii]
MARNNNKKKQRNKKNKNKMSNSQVDLNGSTENVVTDDNIVEDNSNDDNNTELEMEQPIDNKKEEGEGEGEEVVVGANQVNTDLNDAPETDLNDLPVEHKMNDEVAMGDETVNEISNVPENEKIAKEVEHNVTTETEDHFEKGSNENEEEEAEAEEEAEEEINIPGSPVIEEQTTNIENGAIEESVDTVATTPATASEDATVENNSTDLVEKESIAIQKQINENFPEEEPEFGIELDNAEDKDKEEEQMQKDVAESMDDNTIETAQQNDGTESTITSSVPVLPPRHANTESTSQAELAPPPLPARQSSVEDNASHVYNTEPLNQKSMILNRLDLTIKYLKDNDRFVDKPKGDLISPQNLKDSIWTNIINDPVQNIPISAETLENEIVKGIDPTLRPLLWKSLTLGYCRDWEPIYKALVGRTSIQNKYAIVSEIKNYQDLQENDIDSIYNAISALVSLDSTIQPTPQSIALAVAIYRVYENELDAFDVMVTLLKTYEGAALYSENSETLAMLLYQFDRLLEENCHDLYTHLIKKGLRSSMFAADWLLSSFASVLPLNYIPQILDVVILEGIPALLKFSLALMMKNEDILLQLEFDDLFFYCRKRLFEPYLLKGALTDENGTIADNEENEDANEESETSSVEHTRLVVLRNDNFDIQQFLVDAIEKTRITPELINRYSDEYVEIHRNELAQEEQFQQMRDENSKLQNEVRELERDYTSLNREHVTIANELLQNDIKIEGVTEANTRMKMEILQLRKQLDTQIQKNNSNSSVLVPSDIQKDLEMTLKKNGKVMQQNLIYQDRITTLEKLISDIKTATAEGIDYDAANGISSGAFKSPLLSGGWTGFKKVFK